ncbi:GCG_CRPN prefix-to-repeats domain-containing protein [Methylocystis bryophila]|uniref:Uncharacterized protein n=1 Tax=Methylocystis bryophila TaxID=655015 RepID=A0A1W6MQG8_9HYPH|nr:hypothetical protein [Methylocystis bryophila]ARN79827.1 hypothetical protein B1812_00680 [Methylocystis bryophila]BDV39711.1 hypothetical protein DSM21852_29640 [Methylocystis bryophila]
MRLTTRLLAAAAITVAGVTASQAMPLVSSDSAKGAPIEQVGWRCGPGWHLNGWGRCAPNRFWRPYRRYW